MNTIYDGSFVLGQTSATNFVAGNGIKIDEPSAGTVRIGNDETVLFENANGIDGNTAITLSESVRNFEYVRIEFKCWDGGARYCQTLPSNQNYFMLSSQWWNGSNNFYHFIDVVVIGGSSFTSYTLQTAAFHDFTSNTVTRDGDAKRYFSTYKVVGINRISGSNA